MPTSVFSGSSGYAQRCRSSCAQRFAKPTAGRRARSLYTCFLFSIVVPAQPLSAYELGDWRIHGTLSQGWIHSKDNNFVEDSKGGTFDFREFGINASTLLGDRLVFGAQVFGRKWGVVGNDDIYLDWLNLTYSFNDAVGLRAGKLRVPYGLYGETRDLDSLRTQVLLPQGVYTEAFRQFSSVNWGAQVFGNIDTGRWGAFDYSFQYGQSDVDVDSGELNRLGSYVSLQVEDADDGDTGGLKLVWMPPLEGLRLGVTYSWMEFVARGNTDGGVGVTADFDLDLKDQWFLVASAEYAYKRATLVAEYLHADQKAEVLLTQLTSPPFKFLVDVTGHYVAVNYELSDRLTAGIGYSKFTIDQSVRVPGIPGANGQQDSEKSLSLSLRYDITSNFVAKFEQQFSSGTATILPIENPDGLEDDWSMSLIKLSWVF